MPGTRAADTPSACRRCGISGTRNNGRLVSSLHCPAVLCYAALPMPAGLARLTRPWPRKQGIAHPLSSLPRPHQSSSFPPVLDGPLSRLLVLTHIPFDHSLTIRALLALPEPLLHRAADAALGRKVLADGAGAVKRPSDSLRRAADGAGACFYWKTRVSD